jgi:general secretion pathway protein D
MMKNINNRMPETMHWSAVFILLCTITGVQLAHAQEPNTNQLPGKPETTATNEVAIANKGTGSNKPTFNFVDADIESVIVAFGDYTNTTFIIDPRVKGKINLVYDKPLSKAQAFQLLTSVLRLQGYVLVPGNGYLKVVPEADAKLQAVPTQVGTVRGDQIATQIFHLNYESANNLVPVLRPLIAPNNTINADPGNNTLIITDYADNLLRLGKIIATLDEPATNNMDVVPIRYAVANDIAAMVNRLLEPSATAGGDAGRVTLLAYPRTNSVVVRAQSEARANLAKTLIAKFDQPTAQPGNVHVVYLKNAEATKLALILRAVVSSDTSATNSASSSSSPSAPSSSSTSSTSSASSPAPAQGPLPSGGTAGFIQADPTTNSLIITASESVYRDLRTVIDQLDARRAQVYIESMIVEVDASKAAELGAQWAALSGSSASNYRAGAVTGFSTGGNNLISQSASKLATGVPLAPGNGLTLAILNHAGVGAMIHALETDTSANILSMPNLITLDNEEAKIVVGQNVPFVTGQYTTAASAGSAGVNPFQTVERHDIGLTLRVRPQISQGGTVKMAIYQETSAITDTTNPAGLITSKRSLDTNVLVDDGQIIVLGGLIDDNLQDSVEKVPGLSAIPIIGNLFQYKTRSRTKTNLMIFLRPTIVRSNEQSVSLAGDRYDFIRNEGIVSQPERSVMLPNMGEPQLPPLQDGRLIGGLLFNKTAPSTPTSASPAPQQPAAPQQ